MKNKIEALKDPQNLYYELQLRLAQRDALVEKRDFSIRKEKLVRGRSGVDMDKYGKLVSDIDALNDMLRELDEIIADILKI